MEERKSRMAVPMNGWLMGGCGSGLSWGVPYVTGDVNADEGFLVFHNN